VTKGLYSRTAALAIGTVLFTAVPWQAEGQNVEAQERRRNIRYMEGVLVQAVRVGAELVGKELERYEPTGVTVLMGTPRARGFVLEGHGVFFDVEVPDMNQSVVWSVMIAQRDRQIGNALDSLRTALRSMPDGAAMQQAQTAVQLLGSTIGPVQPKDALPDVKDPMQPAKETVAITSGPAAGAKVVTIDPRKIYQSAVIGSLVDAMLGYSVQMSLGSDEWLTVAARGNDSAIGPQQNISDSTTIIVRVRGSDLATYHADQTRRAEIREKVQADARVF
jgi:hypothetical protein